MNKSILGMNHSARSAAELDGPDTTLAADLGARAAVLVAAGKLAPDFAREKTIEKIHEAVVLAETPALYAEALIAEYDAQMDEFIGADDVGYGPGGSPM